MKSTFSMQGVTVFLVLFCLWILASIHPTNSISAADYFVAPAGLSSADGTQERPWDLTTAFDKTQVIKPGDVVWLRGGTYGTGGATLYLTKLVGTKKQPIIIRNYPGERAIINGGISANGPSAYNWFWGFEITNTSQERRVKPSDRPTGLNLVGGNGHSVINLIVHNAGHPGIGFWSPVADDPQLYGNILWGNGIYDIFTSPGTLAAPWTRGSPFYMQNKEGSKYIEENITFRNFTTGMKAYTQGGFVDGFRFIGNIAFDAPDWNFLNDGGAKSPQRRLLLRENYLYRPPADIKASMRVGYNDDQGDAVIENNYIVNGTSADGALFVRKYKEGVVVKNNTLVSNSILAQFRAPFPDKPIWDNNTYFSANPKFKLNDTTLSATEWQALGYDQNSQINTQLPIENKIFVRPNKYQAGRGHIVVYNWEKKSEQQIDVSTVLKTGDVYELRDAQNYFKVLTTGTYNGSSISVPLNLTEVAPFIGSVTHIENQHSPTDFNAFVISVASRELEDLSGTFTFSDPRRKSVPAPTVEPTPTPSPSPTPVPDASCRYDINIDAFVDILDYNILVNNFDKSTVEASDPRADINEDGMVNTLDYQKLLEKFLQTCE